MSTTKYYKKAHKKWASAEAKQGAEHQAREWQELQQSWHRLAERSPDVATRQMEPLTRMVMQYDQDRS